MLYKELLSGVAIVLTFVAFIPYIRAIRQGTTRPHVFSWIIWGSTTFIVFLAQLADRGGIGAWPIGVSGVITLYVAWLAWRHKADDSITRCDWVFLLTALASLPLWYMSDDPLWTVVILTTIDLLGFAPTFRKAFRLPDEENVLFFYLMALRNLAAAAALVHYSFTTLLFPLATGSACVIFILMVSLRRRKLR